MIKRNSNNTKPPKNKMEDEALKEIKRYIKKGSVCKVTFRLPKEAVNGIRKVTVVGDFNEWDKEASPMKKLKDGSYSTTIELVSGKSYRYKYILDDTRWENDWAADRYEFNPYGSENSVVIV
jgi:1,4-alpha-glucan branching enzyme